MEERAGPGGGPVARFCAELKGLRQDSGYDMRMLARQLKISRAQLYAILDGQIKRPPDWAAFVRPLVEACTGGGPGDVAQWRLKHAVMVELYEELRRQDHARPPAGAPAAAIPRGQIVVGEIPCEPPGFVAREALGRLAAAMERRSVAVGAVTGLRGVGKTQLAAAYARQRVSDGWELVGWVPAETSDALLTGLARVADRLGVADPDGDSRESARRLQEHLSTRPGTSLLVLDNAADPDVVRPFIPAAGRTQVIITSTDQAFTELGEPVAVTPFSRPESAAYLAARTELDDQDGAEEVATVLGDLPIGLAQAAATIRHRHLTYPRYLDLLRSVPVRTLLGAVRGGDYRHSAAAALLLSVQAAETADPTGLTGLVLRVVAALTPHGTRRELLAGLTASSWSSPGEDGLDDALDRCVSGSLLTWSVVGDAVIMHRLLGRVLRERDQAGADWPGTVTAALDLLEPRLFPLEGGWAKREQGSELIAQIEALWEGSAAMVGGPGPLLLRQLRARSWAVGQLRATADFNRAIGYGKRLLTDCARILGPDHVETLAARENLAATYASAGQLDEAISLHRQALADRERLLGPDHPDTLASLNSLAEACWAAARPGEAILLHERALVSRERVLGPDHPDTLLSCLDLASAYWTAGRRDEALERFQRTLASYERILGAHHPDTLIARNNVAAAYALTGRVDEAIPLHQQTLADRQRLLGPDHPDTLYSRNNLAHCYQLLGRVDEAIPLHQQTLADRERVLGPVHPATLLSRDNLAAALAAAGRVEEAISLHQQTLADRERVLGPDHQETLRSRDHLAVALSLAGRREEAVLLHQQVLADRERLLGADHPDTLASREHLEQAQAQAQAQTRSPEPADPLPARPMGE